MKTRKKIIATALLISMLASACDNNQGAAVITNKRYQGYYDKELPAGICIYYYRMGYYSYQFFQDSCTCYHIGDTIVGGRVKQREIQQEP